MKKNTKPDVYKMITDKIIKSLEAGTVPWHQDWFSIGRPVNMVSGKHYQGVNVLLLSSSGFSSPIWMTYRQAAGAGGHVKAGEKGTQIVFWKFIEKTVVTEEGEKLTDRQGFLRYHTVFNLDQTEDVKLPAKFHAENTVPSSFGMIDEAQAIVDNYKECPAIVTGEPCYRPKTDVISCPGKESFKHPERYYNTLYHEMIHSTGHKTRLNRVGVQGTSRFGTYKYGKEELIAEIGAAFLSGLAGTFEETADDSVAYIDGWLEAIKGDKKLIVTAAAKAQKAVDYVTA